MTKTITFNELRKVKDDLPSGSMTKIADELGIEVDAVRTYFGGKNSGVSNGIHIEPGPDGGMVMLEDTKILEVALRLIWEQSK